MTSKSRRRRRSKGGGNNSGNGASIATVTLAPGSVPTDEQLELEAAELENELQERYDLAKKKDLDLAKLQKLTNPELLKIAKKEKIADAGNLPKQKLVFEILRKRAEKAGFMIAEGTLEIMPEGFGFLRSAEYSYLPCADDVYVSPSQVRRFGLRRGMVVKGLIRPPKEAETYFAMLRVEEVNGRDPKILHELPTFENLTPLHPNRRIQLEIPDEPTRIEPRIIDMVTPLGFGQRALVVAPPRTGKTVILQQVTHAIAKNHPEAKVIVLLIDERPEEVTDFERNTPDSVEVVASTFDEEATRHIAVAEIVIEKARRMVEFGDHVVILLDSITRLARGYNNGMSGSGKIGSGGVDNAALHQAQEVLRVGPEHRGRRLAHHHRDGAGRHRQPGRRGDLRRVQGNRQRRTASRPQARREAGLPGDRHRGERHPAGGAPPRSAGARTHHPTSEGRVRHERGGGDGTASITTRQDEEQWRIPDDDEHVTGDSASGGRISD